MKHGLACYPKKYIGKLERENGWCIRFETVTVKLRQVENDGIIKLPDCSKAIPIRPTGTDITTLAVRIPEEELYKLYLDLREKYA